MKSGQGEEKSVEQKEDSVIFKGLTLENIKYDPEDPEVDQQIKKDILADREKGSLSPVNSERMTLFFEEYTGLKGEISSEIEKVETKIQNLQTESEEIPTPDSLASSGSGKTTSVNEKFKNIKKTFERKISELENYKEELEKYKTSALNEPLTYEKHYENQSYDITIKHFGINPVRSTYNEVLSEENNIKTSKNKPLHPIEVWLIRKAIAVAPIDQKIAVLVDIFARNNDGSIKFAENKPEIHTIVLYIQSISATKGPAKSVLVIDPSNSDSSKHVATNDFKIFLKNENEELIKIESPAKSIRIYAPGPKICPAQLDNSGPCKDQYRDCIDIAVKIAFMLNDLQENISSSELGNSVAIQAISNQMLHTKLTPPFHIGNFPFRAKQASDKIICKKINHILVSAYYQNFQKIPDLKDTFVFEEIFKPANDTIIENILRELQVNYEYNKYDEAIIEFTNTLEKNIQDIQQAHMKAINIFPTDEISWEKTDVEEVGVTETKENT